MAVINLVARRLVTMLVTIALVSVLIFALTQLLPGDVAQMVLGQYATPEKLAALREQMGLNAPAHVQYLDWAGGLLRGDFGQSLVWERDIEALLLYRLRNSLFLAGFAFLGVTLLGITFGIIAAVRPGSRLDRAVTAVSYVGVSMPEFVSGTLLLFLFAGYVLNIFPATLSAGFVEPWQDPGGFLMQLVLPGITAMLVVLAYAMRMTRSNMLEVLDKPYVRTARLKGLPERTVVVRHALKNAMMPTVTLLSINVGWLVGGLVITEQVFAYPGLGDLVVDAIQKRDVPLIQGAALIISLVYVAANFTADLVYMWLNPKVRTG